MVVNEELGRISRNKSEIPQHVAGAMKNFMTFHSEAGLHCYGDHLYAILTKVEHVR
ncbi:MAG TPA: hypothetical protein VI338_07570 [Nitrososphaera sp.]|nr:hypothetical protein [Nitrososphaera sp.]